MQLEATTQDLMGHKTMKSEHFSFWAWKARTFRTEVLRLGEDLTTY